MESLNDQGILQLPKLEENDQQEDQDNDFTDFLNQFGCGDQDKVKDGEYILLPPSENDPILENKITSNRFFQMNFEEEEPEHVDFFS